MKAKRFFAGVCLVALLAGSGCESLIKRDRRKQLERVARDWTLTIRASQVVPVYPLTQDLQPGDVFLVQRSVRQQEATFDERGFLPIDLQIARVGPSGYEPFYANYMEDHSPSPTRLPGDWRHIETEQSWELTPRAGFPSYTFEVSNSAGLSLAVPVQAVPVGLSMMGASKATGSITILNAFTYGIDVASIQEQVRNDASIQSFLKQVVIPDNDNEHYYIRVISRVFATRNMVVTLTADSNSAGGVDVGVPKPVSVDGTHPSGADQIKAVQDSLASIQDSLPGGSLQAVSAKNRSVTFSETFDEPIIFGYHGFDMAILSDHTLGPVVPTFLVLDQGVVPPATTLADNDLAFRAILELLRAIESAKPATAAEVTDAAAERDSDFDTLYKANRGKNMSPSIAWVDALFKYQDTASSHDAGMKRVTAAQGWLIRAAKDSELDLSGGH